MIDLSGKVVLVTGAGGTIGAGIAARFADEGAQVVTHRGLADGDLRTEGFKIILSPRIPMLVAKHLRGEVDQFLESQGLDLARLDFFVLHPGGTKVLDNVRDTLGLEEAKVESSRRTLREYGNLSSAAVHFAARDLLDHGKVRPGAFGLMIAMGPGFTVELALLRGVA